MEVHLPEGMAEVLNDNRAILVWISRDDHLVHEMREICSSAGFSITAEVRQNRKEPDPRFYLGAGKVEELKGIEDAKYLVLPADLTPSQVFAISKGTSLIVMDRIRMILELFKKRANTPESRLQVELADLHHQLPIIKEYIHQGTLTERPGFLGGGEYRVDYYYEMARKRMASIREKLRRERKARSLKRSLRKRKGSNLIAIAGYTNAGKSTLLNALMEEDVVLKGAEVSPRVFTTLSTTTRRMKGGRNCLITDTVGFIRDLPPWLIEGFMSTLEEVFESDIVLLVVDSSDDHSEVKRKLEDSLEILRKGGTTGRIVVVLNKSDLTQKEVQDTLSKTAMEELKGDLSRLVSCVVPISASTGEGLTELIRTVHSLLPALMKFRITVRQDTMGFDTVREAKRLDPDARESYLEDKIIIEGSMEERLVRSLARKVEKEGGACVLNTFPNEE